MGYFFAVLAFLIWGFVPFFWKQIDNVSVNVIISNRIVWSLVFAFFFVLLGSKIKTLPSILKNKKKIFFVFIASFLIVSNWGIFVFAVNNNRIIETSLGYYICPIFTVFCSLVFFKEKMNYLQKLSFGIAIFAILLLIVIKKQMPWISILLALTFSLYGSVKKIVQLGSMTMLLIEMLLFSPIALFFLYGFNGDFYGLPLINFYGNESFWLIATGIITLSPLYLYSRAIKYISLSSVGYIQFLGPTITFLIGLIYYKEKFDIKFSIVFLLIWVSIFIYFFGLRTNKVSK